MTENTLFGADSAAPRSWLSGRWAAWRPFAWLQSLKARLALGALVLLFAGMLLTTSYMTDLAQTQLVLQAEVREHLEARQLAAILGHRLARLQQSLAVSAEQLDPAILDSPSDLARFLVDKPLLRASFANLFLADDQGRVRLLADASGVREPGVSVGDRSYFQRAVATGRATISEPVAGRVSNEPVILFAQPLPSPRGVWGVFGGALRLSSRDLVEDLVETLDADDTSIIVITDESGRVLAHPQSAYVLKDLATDPRLAEAAVRWRRHGRPLVANAGEWSTAADIIAMAGEASSGWHVWRVASREALLTPMREARAATLKLSFVTACSLAGLLVAFMSWQLLPLWHLEQRANRLLLGDESDEWPVGNGEIGRLAATIRHVWAERAQADRFNLLILRKLTSVMGASPVGLVFMQHERFELVSAECCRLLGVEEGELVGQPGLMIFADADDFARLIEAARCAFRAGGNYEGEWRLVSKARVEFWARIRARPVEAQDPNAGSIWSLYNIDDQIASRQLLEHAVVHDALTGVLNRKGFGLHLAAAFAASDGTPPASVVMIDLDHFKPVNDEGGHSAGDAMLKGVARAIASQVRSSDYVARLGGDEFGILLPACDPARAAAIAEKVHASICGVVISGEGRSFRVGASLGVAVRRAAYANPEQWLEDADAACYEAKRAGRNCVRVASERALPPPATSEAELVS